MPRVFYWLTSFAATLHMPVTIKELVADHGEDHQWFVHAYPRWLRELDATLSLVDAELEMQLRGLLAARERRIFLIYRDTRPAGFAVVEFAALAGHRLGRSVALKSDYQLIDFFVEREARRLGVGSEALRLLLLRFRGVWEVSQLESDHDAIRFWRAAIGRLTNGTFSEQRHAGRWYQRFEF